VADAFLGSRPNGAKLRSLDRDGANHRLANLAYLTDAEAAARGLAANPTFGNRGAQHPAAKLTEAKVIEIRRLFWVEKWSREAIARHIPTDSTRVGVILTRRSWGHLQDGFPAYVPDSRPRKHGGKLTPADLLNIHNEAAAGRLAQAIWEDRYRDVVGLDYLQALVRKARKAAGLPRLKPGRKPKHKETA